MGGRAATVALVTGGRGFIGAAAARALAEAGFTTRIGARRARDGETACDLDSPQEVRAAVEGVSLVVHAAYGDVGAMAGQCRTLLDAMSAAGVENLIHLSSIAVYGAAQGTVAETTAATGALDAYGAAKIACEAAVRAWAEAAADGRRRAVVLRPGVVYGAGSRFWIDKMAERIRLGAWGVFGPAGEGPAPLVHVDDVAALIAAAAARLAGETCAGWPAALALNVVGPETPSWNAYFTALAARLGADPPRRIGGAALALRQTLALGAKVWRKAGLPGGARAALAPTRGEMALFARRATYPTLAARDFLDFAPRIGLDVGLDRSVGRQETRPDP